MGALLGPTAGWGAETEDAPAYIEVAVTDGGVLAGRVTYSGARTSELQQVTRDTQTCGSDPKSDRTIQVDGTGGLAGVVVSLRGVTTGRLRAATPDVDMMITGCEFEPHVTSITIGKKLTLRNADGILHRPRGDIGELSIFQWAMPLPQRLPKKVRDPGIMEIRCTLHPWSRAWVGVFPHPYHAVTNGTGGFEMLEIPAGEYTVRFWHEVLGEQTREVTLESGGAAMVLVVYE